MQEIMYNRCDGTISKLTKIDERRYINQFGIVIDLDKCAILGKTSPNIIDLIEVGDYVNGVEVIDKYKFGEQQRLVMIQTMEYGYENEMLEEHIKSIVTKEQFKAMEYEL